MSAGASTGAANASGRTVLASDFGSAGLGAEGGGGGGGGGGGDAAGIEATNAIIVGTFGIASVA